MLSCVDDERSTTRASPDAEVAADAVIRAARIQARAAVVASTIQARGMVRAARITAAVTLLATCLAGVCGLSGVGVGGYLASEAAKQGAPATSSEPGRLNPPSVVAATVVNTFSAEIQRDVGVFAYSSQRAGASKVAGYFKGTRVRISCVDLHGRQYADRALGVAATTWARVWSPSSSSGENGVWIPALYLQMSSAVPPPC